VQAEGLICDKCGMKLPRVTAVEQPDSGSGGAVAKKKDEAVWVRCRSCGAPAKGGDRCGDCGREVPMPEGV
jgi:hypothetical protein